MIIKPTKILHCGRCLGEIFSSQTFITQNDQEYHCDCADSCHTCREVGDGVYYTCDACGKTYCDNCDETYRCELCDANQCPDCACETYNCSDCGDTLHIEDLQEGGDERLRCYDCHREFVEDTKNE